MDEKLLCSNTREFFNKLKFRINNKELKLNEYDLKNIDLLSKMCISKKNSIIVHPGGDLVFILSIIVSSIVQYLYNMNNPENNLLSNLSEGNRVVIDGGIARYKGIVNGYNNTDQIKLEYIDGTRNLPLNMSYKLIPYNGSSKKLSKLPTKKSAKRNKTKKIISNILDFNIEQLSNIIKYSTLIISQKNSVMKYIKALDIQDNNETNKFSTLFPCAYYSNGDSVEHFAGNYSKREPLLKITSKLSVGMDLIRANKDIKTVIINLSEINNQDVGDIERIINRNSIDNVIIINEWSKISKLDYWLNSENKFDIIAWNKEALRHNINLFSISKNNEISFITIEQNSLIDNYLDRTDKIQSVEINEDFDKIYIETRKMLKEISKLSDNNYIKEFLIIAYSLLVLYEKCCFPLVYLENMVEEERLLVLHPRVSIEKLRCLKETEIKEFLGDSYTEWFNRVITNLDYLRESILFSNPKWHCLIELIKENQGKKVVFIFQKQYYVDVIKRKFPDRDMLLSVELCSGSTFDDKKLYSKIFFSCILKHKKIDIMNNCYSNEYNFILYSREKMLLKSVRRKNNLFLNKIESCNFLQSGTSYENDEMALTELSKDELNEVNMQFDMEDLIYELMLRHTYIDSSSNYVNKVECIRTVIFETGEKAFLTKHYRASLLDRENEEIEDVLSKNIKINDELVFIRDTINEDKEIVDHIIDNLMGNENFRVEYGRSLSLSNVWRNSLINFMDENQYTEKIISHKLKEYGVSRSFVTITNWIKDRKTVGPNDKDVYYALARMCDDKNFIDNWEDVYKACSIIRSLHIKLKKYLAKSIVESIVGNVVATEFDHMIEDIIRNRGSLAQVLEVKYIKDEVIQVPMYMANKLIT